jgi:DnaK suppressor protein
MPRAPAGAHSPDFIPLLSMTGRPYISSPASRGALYSAGVGNASGQEEERRRCCSGQIQERGRGPNGYEQDLPALRQRAFHERAPAGVFPRQAARLEGGYPQGSQGDAQHLQDENQNHADFADRASSETDRAIELRAGDRQRKLIAKIDAALQRLVDGTYGYCEEIGEPIALKRLEARPIATLSVEAQERHERRERVYRDD